MFLFETLCSFLLLGSLVSLGEGSSDVASLCLSKQTNCSVCISAHPSCSWCTEKLDTFTAMQERCKIKSENLKSCSPENIIDPKSSEEVIKDEKFGANSVEEGEVTKTMIQLKPQHMKIKIRPGEVVKTNVTYKKLTDYPLDLYYVLDLSLSMQDDLENLKSFGGSLVTRIKNITDNVNLGFGTFVDKVLMPYASDDATLLKLICPSDIDCQPTFGFRHQLTLTSDGSKFKDAVDRTVISSNIDVPEGSIDALMQIAVCKEIIKWRPQALHVILLTTDAEPHIALDGKIANVHDPTSKKCELKQVNDGRDSYEYTRSLLNDYPSLGQLRNAFEENQIQAIFAVTKEVEDVYQSFPTVFTNSYVETLSNDSSNIMTVISNAYDRIKNVFTFSEPKYPDNIKTSYRILCPGSSTWVANSLKCTNVQINSEVILELTLNASCPGNDGRGHRVSLTSATLANSVNIDIEYICDCDCNSTITQNRTFCNNRGDATCGMCTCDSGWSGPNCQCSSLQTTAELENSCKSPTNGERCSGQGTCDCGSCTCKKNTKRLGKYCQCVPTGCRKKDGESEYCGGSERGSCNNCDNDQQCECNNDKGWFFSNQTNLCDCSDSLCVDPSPSTVGGRGMICSGRGTCTCNTCSCFNPATHYGDYCEKCGHPRCMKLDNTCSGEKHQLCARCLYKDPTGKSCDEVCVSNKIVGEVIEQFPDCDSCDNSVHSETCKECAKFDKSIFSPIICTVKDEQSCEATYKLLWNTAYRSYYLLVKRQNIDQDCPAPIDPIAIALPVGGSIILAGLVAMIMWRIVQNRLDRQRYEEFLKELKEANWHEDVQNPVYKGCITHIENPKFVG